MQHSISLYRCIWDNWQELRCFCYR